MQLNSLKQTLRILLTLLFSFLQGSCIPSQNKTPAEKIKFYEARAKQYQSLSDLQRLTPPYNSLKNKHLNTKLNNKYMRTKYSSEALRFRKLAQNAREEYSSDSNKTDD